MKRILSILVVLVMCLAMFTACPQQEVVVDLEAAQTALKAQYQNYYIGTDTLNDYTLETVIMANGVTYSVKWVSNNEAVTLVENEDGTVTVDVPLTRTDIPYGLTATITAPDKSTTTLEFEDLVVPASNIYTIPEALAAPDKTKVVVTGTVIDIGTPYDEGHKNISVTIEDAEGNRLYVYRLKANVQEGQIIRVTGELSTFNDAKQIAAGGTAEILGTDPNFVAPQYTEYTIPEALLLKDLARVILQGTIVKTEVDSKNYNNITIADAEGNEMYIHRPADGSNLKVGDVVKVTGKMTSYKGSKQVNEGATVEVLVAHVCSEWTAADCGNPEKCVLCGTAKEGSEATGNHTYENGTCTVCGGADPDYKPEGGETTLVPTVVATPEVGVAYKFGMVHGNLNKTYYLAGGMDGFYLATTEDYSAAIDLYLETVEGGYHLYTMVDGVKTYINMVISTGTDGQTHVNGAYEATASTVYTWDSENNTVVSSLVVGDAESENYWLGTRNDKSYDTVGPCAVRYNGFFCQFYTLAEGTTTPDPEQPGEGGETPDPEQPGEGGETTEEKAYIFGMTQAKVNNTIYYLVGGMNGYYMATTTDASAALKVYLEETEGGYYFYCYVNNVKTYINMVVSGTHVNGAYETTASTVYRIDSEKNTLIAVVNGEDYWFATRNDNTYTTMGPCKVSYAGFYGVLYSVESEEGGETPAPHEHNFVEGKCECGESDPDYVAPEQPEPEQPEQTAGGSADFDSLLPGKNGDSGYKNTHTTTNGWVIVNSAIQAGGSSDMNPQFVVVGPDNSHKAVCLNGKTSAPGKITSSTLTGGISKLTMNYTKMFTDTVISVTITITDLATGTTYTHVVERTEAKDTKYVVWTDEWVLDTAIEGDFTIEIVNNCPTGQDGNKDRFTILDLSWTK